MITNTNYNLIKYNISYLFLKYLPEIFYPLILSYFYKKKFGRELNLKNPTRFSEKILWTVLYDKNPMKMMLSDKLKAKEYVKKLIPQLKSAEVYQIASSFNNLDFSKAPDKFVIKTNHAWKSQILIEDKNSITKEDYNYYRKYYNKVLNINYAYWGTPELQYKNIKRKVYLEEYLTSNEKNPFIREYEVYCFNGKPEFLNYSISYTGSEKSIFIDEKKDLVESQTFDIAWKQVDFKIRYNNNLSAPDTINKNLILYYAEILATGFDFVRVDIFEVNNELYFGEFTFSPCSGFIEFYPDKYDLVYGKKWMN